MQAGFFTKYFSKAFPAVRNRLLSDPRFLFKVGAEVAIDAGESFALSTKCTFLPQSAALAHADNNDCAAPECSTLSAEF